MLGQSNPERAVLGALHSELPARLLHDLRHSRVVYVTDGGKKMVLEVKVQTSKEPCPDRAVAVVIERYFSLMHGPRVLHLMGSLIWQGELGTSRAVRQLEYDRQGYAHNEDNDGVVEDDRRDGMVG